MKKLQMVEAKELTIYIEKGKKGKKDEKGGTQRVTLGVRIIFNDGLNVEVKKHDGTTETQTGRGTMVFYHYKFQTWSVTSPQTPQYVADQPITDQHYKVLWQDGDKTRTMREKDLRKIYPYLSTLALIGFEQAQAEAAAKKAA